MTDLEALQQLAVALRHVDIPPALRAWLGQKQRALQQTGQARKLAYAGRHGSFVAGPVATPRPWTYRGAGGSALALAALNPNAWLDLRRARTRRAWHAAISAGIESLARIDSDLANAFAFGEYRDAPGLHLRELPDGRVQMLWRPASGLVVDVSSP